MTKSVESATAAGIPESHKGKFIRTKSGTNFAIFSWLQPRPLHHLEWNQWEKYMWVYALVIGKSSYCSKLILFPGSCKGSQPFRWYYVNHWWDNSAVSEKRKPFGAVDSVYIEWWKWTARAIPLLRTVIDSLFIRLLLVIFCGQLKLSGVKSRGPDILRIMNGFREYEYKGAFPKRTRFFFQLMSFWIYLSVVYFPFDLLYNACKICIIRLQQGQGKNLECVCAQKWTCIYIKVCTYPNIWYTYLQTYMHILLMTFANGRLFTCKFRFRFGAFICMHYYSKRGGKAVRLGDPYLAKYGKNFGWWDRAIGKIIKQISSSWKLWGFSHRHCVLGIMADTLIRFVSISPGFGSRECCQAIPMAGWEILPVVIKKLVNDCSDWSLYYMPWAQFDLYVLFREPRYSYSLVQLI